MAGLRADGCPEVRRICVVITARPSYSRIKTALVALRERSDVHLDVVVTASALLSRFGSAVETIQADGFPVAARVHTVMEGDSPAAMAKTTALGIFELSSVFMDLRPDAVMTIADRYETLATAVAASYMNIPVVHVQGGEVTGSIDEKVRHAVTKLSDLHLVSTERARERVVRMGERPESVHVTGCPSIDLAAEVLADPGLTFDPMVRYGGVGAELRLDEGYLIVMQHPVTTEYEQSRLQVTETLMAIRELDQPTLWFWPNVDAGGDGTSNAIRTFRELHRPTNIHFFKNMEPTDFLRLLVGSRGIVGNSSVGIRECAYLGVPAVNIGTRQDGRERGPNVIDVGYDRAAIVAGVRHQQAMPRPGSSPLYGDGNAGQRIAALVAESPLDVHKHLTY